MLNSVRNINELINGRALGREFIARCTKKPE